MRVVHSVEKVQRELDEAWRSFRKQCAEHARLSRESDERHQELKLQNAVVSDDRYNGAVVHARYMVIKEKLSTAWRDVSEQAELIARLELILDETKRGAA